MPSNSNTLLETLKKHKQMLSKIISIGTIGARWGVSWTCRVRKMDLIESVLIKFGRICHWIDELIFVIHPAQIWNTSGDKGANGKRVIVIFNSNNSNALLNHATDRSCWFITSPNFAWIYVFSVRSELDISQQTHLNPLTSIYTL